MHVFAHDVRMDGSAIKADFGFAPRVGYEEGIAHTLKWFKSKEG